MNGTGTAATVFITSPLEAEHVAHMRAVAEGRPVEIIYEPDLLPPTRYVADHKGVSSLSLTTEQRRRWRAALERANVLWDFPAVAPGGPSVLEMAPRLEWVQTTSSGVGQMVRSLGLQRSDVIVTTASGVHAQPLAEFVMLALLSHVKDLRRLQREKERRHWQRFCADELDGKTLVIVGPGRVGREVARVARAFGMRVLALARDSAPERAAALGVDGLFAREQLYQALGEADAVVLSCPHTPETENLIDARAFQAMKDGVMFVNIARGQVVDEPSLLAALRSGKVAFAALDVFRQEPLPLDSPFWQLPNVLINPHSASTAYRENAKITEIFRHNLICFVDGRRDEMRNVLDKIRLY